MNPKTNNVDDILQLPEKIAQKKCCNIVVCIDEFQQIAEFKDSKTFMHRMIIAKVGILLSVRQQEAFDE